MFYKLSTYFIMKYFGVGILAYSCTGIHLELFLFSGSKAIET